MSHRTRDLPPLSGFAHVVRELRYHEASRQGLAILLIALLVATAAPVPWDAWLGAPLVVIGALLRLYASGFISKNAELASDGPYALVRHPLYSGNILIIIGFSLLNARWWALPAALLFFWFYYPPAIQYEDSKLRRLFGAAWEQWAERTPALMPLLRNIAALRHSQWSLMKSLRRNGEPLITVLLTVALVLVVRRLG
jgi:protein-S-isoprenylcysteine O-methyltransferase Ste14